MKHTTYENVMYQEECYQIQGAIYDVNGEMGSGFLEAVYQECLERELSRRQIPFESQKELELFYKGEPLTQKYIPDLICYGKIIVELKAIREIRPEHQAQLLNYLKAASMELGLLVNFGAYPKTEIIRMANTQGSLGSR